MATYEEKLAAGRLGCCIPGCQRTFKRDGATEIICGQHYRAAPLGWRRRVAMLRKRYRALCGDGAYWQFPAGSPKRLEGVKLARMFNRAWALVKKSATERALGI